MAKQLPYWESHTKIKCIDCGAERVIRNQDRHQVTRCKPCQRKYRIARRSELRRLHKGQDQ